MPGVGKGAEHLCLPNKENTQTLTADQKVLSATGGLFAKITGDNQRNIRRLRAVDEGGTTCEQKEQVRSTGALRVRSSLQQTTKILCPPRYPNPF